MTKRQIKKFLNKTGAKKSKRGVYKIKLSTEFKFDDEFLEVVEKEMIVDFLKKSLRENIYYKIDELEI